MDMTDSNPQRDHITQPTHLCTEDMAQSCHLDAIPVWWCDSVGHATGMTCVVHTHITNTYHRVQHQDESRITGRSVSRGYPWSFYYIEHRETTLWRIYLFGDCIPVDEGDRHATPSSRGENHYNLPRTMVSYRVGYNRIQSLWLFATNLLPHLSDLIQCSITRNRYHLGSKTDDNHPASRESSTQNQVNGELRQKWTTFGMNLHTQT